MKKFFYNFFLTVFCTANAFGASDVTISRSIPVLRNNQTSAEKTSETVKTQRESLSRATTSRTATRGVQKNTETSNRGTQKSESNVVSRSVNAKRTGVRSDIKESVFNGGRSLRTEAASINSLPSVRRAGVTLRTSTAEVGGRATISNTNIQTGSNIDEQVRGVQNRASVSSAAKTKVVTTESLTNAKELLERSADLNNTCQQQYNECMDQFCAVIDNNQKRCSCSANLDKYAKAQKAVEDANVELNDVAQRIRYVGLSADEIRAIMSATEAELEMSKTKDTTETRSLLDQIADMIKDPTASTTSDTNSINSLLDMDLDFSSDSSDLFGLDLFNNSNDISSKRGRALYNEATKRCKTVLNNCKEAGATETQITGNYDLAIDKDCIAYEQGLTKLNNTLVNNVRSANLMLQKARLAVVQNKNEYDPKGCVAALENCMLDDMVCGKDYLKCVDPTKEYIDENGNVVLGRNISNITAFMVDPNGDQTKGYNNTKITADFIKASSSDTNCANNDGACIVNYLMTKIGTGQTVKEGGLCRAVLDKCQDYTYTTNAKTTVYNPYNDIVVNYIQRAMVNIKAAQSKIISDYAQSCMADVATCYNQQNTQITAWTTTANVDNIYKVMTGACYNVALTCGYAVFAYDVDMEQKMQEIKNESNLKASEKDKLQKTALIHGISEMFYQSLLCPDNTTFIISTTKDEATDNNKKRYINDRCMCNDGYSVYNGACLSSCPSNYEAQDGVCVEKTNTTEGSSSEQGG